MGNLQKENKKLELEIKKQQKQLEKVSKEGSKMELTKFEQQIEDCENKLRIKEQESIDTLAERDSLNDTLVKLQTNMKGLDHALIEKNEEIINLNTKVQEMEVTAKEAIEKIGDHKNAEKEKREMNRKIKQLEKTLKEWETRQFGNVKLISGLEKERDNLQQLLKEAKDGKLSHEDQLYWKDVEIRNRDKDIKALTTKLKDAENELNKKSKSLIDDISELKKANSKCSEMEKQIKNLQRELESGELKNKVDDLQEENTNQKNEITHLKNTLSFKSKDLAAIKSKAGSEKAELEKKALLEKAELEKRVFEAELRALGARPKVVGKPHEFHWLRQVFPVC